MRSRILAFTVLVASCGLLPAAKLPDPTADEIDKIIERFAAKEAEFAQARENYTYKQTAKILEYDDAGNPGGKFEIAEDIVFTNEGKRTERVTWAPANTLRMIQMSPEDEQDLRNVMPFVLTSKDKEKYLVRYLGRQMADEIPCYVFAVKPKRLEAGQRYFSGEIWVDDHDLMIVKTYGRATGLLKKGTDQQFPKFETYREQIDGKYWFPTYTAANSYLHFKDNTVKIRQTVKYQDYKQFKSSSTIVYGDTVKDKNEKKSAEPPKKP
jgi:hypothetical protein